VGLRRWTPINLLYEEGMVELYDYINQILPKLPGDILIIIRLRSMLLIEKTFINEQQEVGKMRHMDYCVWSAIFNQSKEEQFYNILELDKVNGAFRKNVC